MSGPTEYEISGPGLAAALERVAKGEHVHLENEDDPTDRMCSGSPTCEGFDHFYVSDGPDV